MIDKIRENLVYCSVFEVLNSKNLKPFSGSAI